MAYCQNKFYIIYKIEDDTSWYQEAFANIDELISGAERYRKFFKEQTKLADANGKSIYTYRVYLEKATYGFEELAEENGHVFVDYEIERQFFEAMESIKEDLEIHDKDMEYWGNLARDYQRDVSLVVADMENKEWLINKYNDRPKSVVLQDIIRWERMHKHCSNVYDFIETFFEQRGMN